MLPPLIRARRFFRKRPKLTQQIHAVINRARCGRLHKRETRNITGLTHHADRNHLQNNGCQVCAQNLRVGKFAARSEIVLRIQPNRNTIAHTTAPTRTLVRARLRNPLDRKTLHLRACRIPRNAGGTGIDHILDTRHRQRSFRNVRRQHDARPTPRCKHTVLLRERQTRVQRQNLIVHTWGLGDQRLQSIVSIANFAFAREENQDIAGRLLRQLLNGGQDPIGWVTVFVAFIFISVAVPIKRAVANLHRVGAPRNLNNRGSIIGKNLLGKLTFLIAERIVYHTLTWHETRCEMPRESFRINGCGGNNDLQIGALRQNPLQIPQNKINI